jgi:hypothetical protein
MPVATTRIKAKIKKYQLRYYNFFTAKELHINALFLYFKVFY